MNAPVVLPVVHVHIDEAGALAIELDGTPCAADQVLGRCDLRDLLRTITSELDSAVRVEVIEADGTTYTDIELPPERPSETPDVRPTAPVALPGIAGSGFRPGEPVALAYVILEQAAEDDGTTSVHLAPSVLRGRGGTILLVGLESRVTALIGSTV